jgi:hypothetical protein
MNPKCKGCTRYFVPQMKTSGLPYSTCEKCQSRMKTKYSALKSHKENTLEEYNRMTLSTKPVKRTVSRSAKREIKETKPECDVVPVSSELLSEQVQVDDIVPVAKEKRVRKPKVKEELVIVAEGEITKRSPDTGLVESVEKCVFIIHDSEPEPAQVEEQVGIPLEPESACQEPEIPAVEPQVEPLEPESAQCGFRACEIVYNEDRTKVFNPVSKRWCKVDSKAGKKLAVV